MKKILAILFSVFVATCAYSQFGGGYVDMTSFSGVATDVVARAAAAAANTVATNAQTIATNTYRIATNSFDIATNAQDVATNTYRIATNAYDVGTNATIIATNAQDIATNTYRIATNSYDIGTNTYRIATNGETIATNAYGIATNAQDIATNTYRIATNAYDIGTNTYRIATNAYDVSTNANRIATNAQDRAGTLEGHSYVLVSRSGTPPGNSVELDSNTLVTANNKLKVHDRIENKINFNSFEILQMQGVTHYGMNNTAVDAFQDQAGVDLTASTGQNYTNSSGTKGYVNVNYGTAPGSCVTLDGSDDGLRCDTPYLLGTGGTVSAWSMTVWYTNNGDVQIPMIFYGTGAKSDFALCHFWFTTHWDFFIQSAGGDVQSGTPEVTDPGWHFLVCTWTGTTAQAYWDATNYINSNIGVTYTPSSTQVLYIGSSTPGAGVWFNGKIDEVCIYDRVLSATEITNLYNSHSGSYTTNAGGLTHCWHLDENTGNASIDSVGTNVLNFQGAPTWTPSPVCANPTGLVPTNMSLVSVNYPWVTTPTNYLVGAYIEDVSNIVLNTDFFLDMTRDGTNWYTPTLQSVGRWSNTAYTVYGIGTFSGPAHTNTRWRVRATNNMIEKVAGVTFSVN